MTNKLENLEQFTGTDQYYYNPLYPDMKYTDGVKYFAEQAGAYWFLDIIGTEVAQAIEAKDTFGLITLTVRNDKAEIKADDGNGEEGEDYFYRLIGFTDCPEGVWKFYYTNKVLLLPSEY